MTEEETDFLREEYADYPLYNLFVDYIDLRECLREAATADEGAAVLENSKELEILTKEINSRPLEEKINLLHLVSEEMKDPKVNPAILSSCIIQFIEEFLPKFYEQD